MRATLASGAVARYAGRFVWLELDFDKPINQSFMSRHGVTFTPTLFVLDPADERATATKFGGLTLAELTVFLERGERAVKEKSSAPADAALERGEEMVGRGLLADAVTAYREALKLAPPNWPEQNRVVVLLTRALQGTRDFQACAEMAATHAPAMPREPIFAEIALSGLGCSLAGGAAPWADNARKILEPLAVEAVALRSTLRDNRFQLYQLFMSAALRDGDKDKAALWGERWLKEIEATTPADDDERSALDIARVDAAELINNPGRVLPALIASERAMPTNYNASLRLAQMAVEAKRYDLATAACDRGLAHVTGPLGQSWLLHTKADALIGKGDKAGARIALEEAMQAAQKIGNERLRGSNVRQITRALAEIDKQQQ
jgi:tetratricopeptide (TPR) repeat protein